MILLLVYHFNLLFKVNRLVYNEIAIFKIVDNHQSFLIGAFPTENLSFQNL